MSIGDNIKALRESNKLSQIELAHVLGVSDKAVSTWENNKRDPRMGTIQKIADYFGVKKSDIIEGSSAVATPSEPSELAAIDSQLNGLGHAEWVRYGKYLTRQNEYRREASENLTPVRLYTVPAAAGYASPIEGEDYKIVELSNVPYDADFAIRVSGDSMEPYIKDGSIVFVNRSADLSDLDVGVFYLNGDVLIKQVVTDAFRNVHLLSANPKREDANRTIYHDSNDSLVYLGRVIIGKLPHPKYV